MNAALIFLAQQTMQPAQPAAGDGNVTLVIALLLLFAALTLFVVEIFIPSGGLLGLISAVCLVLGVVMLCLVNLTWGLGVAVIALAALPFAIAFALKIWPDTPIGRWLTLNESQEAIEPQQPDVHPLMGKEGQAVTDLRPIGTCVINGKREPCMAAHGMIESGQIIKVVGADGMQLRVEASHDS